jgi:small subunit ribosomal protein S1
MSDMFGDDDDSKKQANSFESMLEASLQGLNVRFEKGDKVDAEVITIGKDEVFVSVKGKDGVVLRSELLDEQGQLTVSVGDHVQLFYMRSKDALLQLRLPCGSFS